MNLVDYIIIGIVAISVLFGLYRGFLASLLNMGGLLVSFPAAFWLYPKLAEWIQQDPQLQRTLLTYTDASSRLGDLNTATLNVANLTEQAINDIVTRVNLPGPFSDLLRSNLSGQIYTGISTVSEYISETIVSACINILCFLVCLAAVYIAISLVGGILRAVFRLPVLKQMDSLAGGLFGLLRGVIIVFALCTLVPMVQTMVSIEAIDTLLAESRLAAFFSGGGLVTAIMNGRL